MKKAIILLPFLVAACQPKHSANPPPPGNVEKQAEGGVPLPGSFIGLAVEDAKAKADKADLPHRIVNEDGKEFPVTRDYRPERLNFTIEKGVVTKVTNG